MSEYRNYHVFVDNVGHSTVHQYGNCKECGYPVICDCMNDERWNRQNSDWYVYCSNKMCPNHTGERMDMEDLDWITNSTDNPTMIKTDDRLVDRLHRLAHGLSNSSLYADIPMIKAFSEMLEKFMIEWGLKPPHPLCEKCGEREYDIETMGLDRTEYHCHECFRKMIEGEQQ